MFYLVLVIYCLIFALLAKLAWTDHTRYLLPNIYNLALAVVFVCFHILTGWAYVTPADALIGAIVGAGFLLIIRAVANKAMKADTVGFGDIKFMAAAGLGLGMPTVFLVLSIGSVIGIFQGLGLYHLEQKKSGKDVDLGRVNVPAGVGFCIAAAALVGWQFYGWWDLF